MRFTGWKIAPDARRGRIFEGAVQSYSEGLNFLKSDAIREADEYCDQNVLTYIAGANRICDKEVR